MATTTTTSITIMANTLAVVSQSGESLSFYDIDSGEKTGHISDLTGEPHELCYDDRTDLLYVTHAYAHGWYVEHGENGHEISIIDCAARKSIDTINITPYGGPHYIVLDKERNILYSSVEAGIGEANLGGIVAIDLHTKKVIQAIPSGAKTHWFVMTPDGRKAYTCNKEAGFVSVLDLHQGKMIAKINLPGGSGCEQPGISNDGQYAYFPIPSLKATTGESLKGTSSIIVISTQTDTISTTIPLAHSGLTIHVDAQDRLLVGQLRFSEDRKPLPGKLSVFTSLHQGFKLLKTLDTGIAPLTLTSTPDAKRAFAANIFSGTVTVFDMEKLQVERTIEVDLVRREGKKMFQGAHGLAVLP